MKRFLIKKMSVLNLQFFYAMLIKNGLLFFLSDDPNLNSALQ